MSKLTIKIDSNKNDKLSLKICQENETGLETVLIEQNVKFDPTGFIATNISSGSKALVKTTLDQKKLLIKCKAGNDLEDISLHVDTTGHVTLSRAVSNCELPFE